METSILQLLQGPEKSTESKWKSYKQKHDVISSRKDFPLKGAKPASNKRTKQVTLSANQRAQLVSEEAACFGSGDKAERVESLLKSGQFDEADLVAIIKNALNTASASTLNLKGSADF